MAQPGIFTSDHMKTWGEGEGPELAENEVEHESWKIRGGQSRRKLAREERGHATYSERGEGQNLTVMQSFVTADGPEEPGGDGGKLTRAGGGHRK